MRRKARKITRRNSRFSVPYCPVPFRTVITKTNRIDHEKKGGLVQCYRTNAVKLSLN